MTAGWCARTSRAAVFAAVCVLLAALAHELMSGGRVPGWALAAGAVATGAAGWCLAGRERGPALIVPVVVGAQAVLHSAFSYARSATPDSGGHATASMGAMDMSGGHSTASMGGMHMDHAAGGSPSLGMLAAHLLAALLCGLWLAHGERAAFRVLRAVGARLAAPLRLPLAPPPTPHHPLPRFGRPRSDRAPRLLLLVHAITSRGPPVGTAVA
ncbi:hypothetical protein PO587_21680 [Streptomyces gilvifuscus]|uniref:Integral-membrane protein n=1 Tax=Streptomyces gilvifuscus TaxID=1550617 RepID=A0ABT5FXA9_9ACTN|nr:hypothetical protein [Streptomyces gilvifuscus]MDC2957077.1 hypothetical protein [Streptomyces gilvifuscus]